MINRYRHRNLTWVDMENPTNEEIRLIMDEFDLNPLVADELTSPTLKPKVDFYKEYIYLILHFPAIRHTHSEGRQNQEVDFIIGKKFIITVHYDTIDPLHKFSKVFEVNSILDRSDMGNHAGYLFFYMIKKLYGAIEHELSFIRDKQVEIENEIFDGREKIMVLAISHLSRNLLDFKQAISVHRGVLESFEKAGNQFFGVDFTHHLRTIMSEYYKVHNEIDELLGSVGELRETNNSLLSTKQNEIMKTLTIMAFVTFPLSLIAAIFGMNTQTLPLIGMENDFWIIIGIMSFTMLLLFTFFKYKNWL
ncbi:hypothetical protein IID26_01380 [Patescibacteria group bacterium]|nr:hypothetical protein [Patescibacteria group bacterium]